MKRLGMTLVVGAWALGLVAQEPGRALRPQQAAGQAAAGEARTALVIGNGAYPSAPLKNPVQDAKAMAEALRKCGFQVTLLENATRSRMVQALRDFGLIIQGGGVGLLYYAGHGMQVKGRNYLVPVDADLASEDEVPYNTLDADAVLAKMESARNRLNILILDACRNNPFARSFRSSSQGLAQMDAPAGSYIAFATSPGRTAADGTGAHGLYTQYLLTQLAIPGLRVEDVFKRVRASVMRDSQQQQVPWESSSITGDFYFNPGSGVDAVESAVTAQGPVNLSHTLTANELKRDGRFIANDNGTVLDTSTDLMWATRDNGFDLDWARAKSHCESFRGAGHADWRLPTQDELGGLYDARKSRPSGCNRSANISVATDLIDITCLWVWASGTRDSLLGNDRAAFRFNTGERGWLSQSEGLLRRALPVRSARTTVASPISPVGTGSGPGQGWRKDLAGMQMAMLALLDEHFTKDKAPSALLEGWRQVGQALSDVAVPPEPGDPELTTLRQFAAAQIAHWKARTEGTAQAGRRANPTWKVEFAEIQVQAILRANIELDETALSPEAAIDAWKALRLRLDKAPRSAEARDRAYDRLQKLIVDKLFYWTGRYAQEVAGSRQ